MAELGLDGPLCFDKRLFVTNLSKSERIKHSQFSQKSLANREEVKTIKSMLRRLV